MHDEIPKNEAGVLFKYKDRLLLDNPEYLIVMRYKVCSSFPLHDLIAFHKAKEVALGQHSSSSYNSDDEDLEEDERFIAGAKSNKALITVMTDRLDQSMSEMNTMRSFGVFAVDETSNEILHYTE